jgi:hypothetical protein
MDESGSVEFGKETILHEVQHAIMAESYNLGKNGDKRFKTISNNVDSIYSGAIEAVRDLQIIDPVDGSTFEDNGSELTYGAFMTDGVVDHAKINSVFADDLDTQNALRRAMYLFNSPMDFMSEVSSRKNIQALMNNVFLKDETYEKIGTEKNKSVLESIFSQFANFFNKIVSFFNGTNVNQKSVLESVMLQNMMLTNELRSPRSVVKGRKNTNVSEKYAPMEVEAQPITGTVREFLTNATKEERSAFRYSLNNNIFKTRCD